MSSYLFLVAVEGTLWGGPHEPFEIVEVGAMACWIEQVLDVSPSNIDEPIDYDGCEYATQ